MISIPKIKIAALLCVALAGASSIDAMFTRSQSIDRLRSIAGKTFQNFKKRFNERVTKEKECFNRDRSQYLEDKAFPFFVSGFYLVPAGLTGSVVTMQTPLSTRTPLGDKVHGYFKKTAKLGGGLLYTSFLIVIPVPTALATAMSVGGFKLYKHFTHKKLISKTQQAS